MGMDLVFDLVYTVEHICAFAHTRGLLLAGRILSGLGAGTEFATTALVLADCWRPEQRGHSYAIATFVPCWVRLLALSSAVSSRQKSDGGGFSGLFPSSMLLWLSMRFFSFRKLIIVCCFIERPSNYKRRQAGLFHIKTDVHNQPLARKLCYSLARPY